MAPRRLLARRLRDGQLLAVDAVLAGALVLTCGYAASEDPLGAGVREPLWLSVVVGVLIGGPVAVRRRRPLAVLGVVLGTSAVALLSGMIPDFAGMAPFTAVACALYTVGVALPGRPSISALAACLAWAAAVLGGIVATGLGAATAAADIGFAGSVLVVSWLLGRVARERRAYAAQVAEQLTHRAVTDERLRIAREMHDVVAHTLSLITVKAAVGNHVAEADPGEARAALRVIEATSRSALVEIRRALGILRAETAYAPAPGLGDLAALAAQAATGGVDVDLTVAGAGDVPEGVGLSVFRIVQESLTNVVKHAAPARCRATVAVEPGEVRIEVVDDGRRAGPPAADGHGLIGIRERVGMYGGDFAAGPSPGGGFRVTARLPYASPA
ncbi:MAG TPA: histidine kinase [Pilimelia sp.]|nr:histidine kinase [Pilimelia sp.]